MLDYLINYVSKYYNWLDTYSTMVVYEYTKFLHIFNLTTNIKLIPTDDIERCWQVHILNTEEYYKYCIEKFGKIIHYKPNLIKKKEDINKTYKIYLQNYGEPKYKLVWTINNFNILIVHNLIPEIKLTVLDKLNKIIGIYNYYPNSVETFEIIIDLINIRFNCNKKNIKIYIDRSKTSNLNLKNIYQTFKLNNNGQIPNELKIIDLVNNYIINFCVIIT
jgi:hypothetical protein